MIEEESIDGSTIFTLKQKNLEIKLTTYGATLLSVLSPDRNGVMEEITLCYQDLKDLKTKTGPYYGAIIGRFANRIENGTFSLNNIDYQLPINNGPNSLHGGLIGFDKKEWNYEVVQNEDEIGIKFKLFSKDGEEGFPGNLSVEVTYLLFNSKLKINYFAKTDKSTPINLTNHVYWNLSGSHKRNIFNHSLSLNCNQFLPLNNVQIPTGEYCDILKTSFEPLLKNNDKDENEFINNDLVELGNIIPFVDGCGRNGIDHCFIVNNSLDFYESHPTVSGSMNNIENNSEKNEVLVRFAATLFDQISGRKIKVFTSQPGIQIYTGNYLSINSNDFPHIQYNGICIETQHFPNSVNNNIFPTTILHPNQFYKHCTEIDFSTV